MLSPTIRIGLRQHTGSFLEELEKLGERTRLRGIDQESWKEACRLVQITEDIAPWYLRRGGTKGPELVAELSKAAEQTVQRYNMLAYQCHHHYTILSFAFSRPVTGPKAPLILLNAGSNVAKSQD